MWAVTWTACRGSSDMSYRTLVNQWGVEWVAPTEACSRGACAVGVCTTREGTTIISASTWDRDSWSWEKYPSMSLDNYPTS